MSHLEELTVYWSQTVGILSAHVKQVQLTVKKSLKQCRPIES
jgi:hypothetical protein